MKKKNRIWIYSLIAIGFVLIFIYSCKKDDSNNPTNDKTTAVFNSQLVYGTMTDQDGNTYKTIKIGTQTWMAENLRTTKYRNGEALSKVTDNTAWSNLRTGAYCNYNNTKNIDTIATYGRLYNWYTVSDNRNIAPVGWHVPIDAEWNALSNYLGGETVAVSGKLKEVGLTHWKRPNTGGATNVTGFTAIPGGGRSSDGLFSVIGEYGLWWSSSQDSIDKAWENEINSGGGIGMFSLSKVFGFSIRCVRDN